MAPSNGIDEKVEDVAQDVSKELRELGRELRHRANDVRKETAKQLHNAATTIRKEAREAGAGAEAVQSADELAKGLEKAAHYLNSKSVEQMGEDTVKVVRRYPLRAVLVTFVVGALIGMWLRGSDYNK
jgi:ElaB/YqjD/DUF883 family membrane-anchored ribosome-binding protein